jgi:hypothetical protein
VMTYYVVLAFKRSEDGGEIVACDPKEARSAEQAIRMAGSLAAKEGHCGAIAFSRAGDRLLATSRCCDPKDSRGRRYRATIDLTENSYGSIK